jgi:hypothetical protein
LTAHVKIIGVRSGLTYQFAVWLITGRGNAVPVEEYAGKILIASAALGIGAISIDFGSFKYYNVTKQGSYYMLVNYPNGASGYMVNQGGDGIAFEVNLINLDEKERVIVLSSNNRTANPRSFLVHCKRRQLWNNLQYMQPYNFTIRGKNQTVLCLK